MPENLSAERFVKELEAHRSPEEREMYQRYFNTGEGEHGDVFIGVRMGQVFALAKEFIEKLLESPVHEVRAGALSFLDRHAATMPRTALRYAIERLDKEQRARYLNMSKVA
jgi:hypothetical protein